MKGFQTSIKTTLPPPPPPWFLLKHFREKGRHGNYLKTLYYYEGYKTTFKIFVF